MTLIITYQGHQINPLSIVLEIFEKQVYVRKEAYSYQSASLILCICLAKSNYTAEAGHIKVSSGGGKWK